jgi:hypothetical protein
MNITNGTVSADADYTNHEDGTWSFRLTFDHAHAHQGSEDDPVPIESVTWVFFQRSNSPKNR